MSIENLQIKSKKQTKKIFVETNLNNPKNQKYWNANEMFFKMLYRINIRNGSFSVSEVNYFLDFIFFLFCCSYLILYQCIVVLICIIFIYCVWNCKVCIKVSALKELSINVVPYFNKNDYRKRPSVFQFSIRIITSERLPIFIRFEFLHLREHQKMN